VKFQVFEDGKIVTKFKPCGAYMFGTDGIALRKTSITCKRGVINCEKPDQEAAGLTLLWPIEGLGKVLLPTTFLPDREQPYNLNVEIARAKLMQNITKREDWSFFSSVEGEGLTELADEARDLFIQAVQNISDSSLSSKLADKALKKAIIFSEKLAVNQACSLFEIRGSKRGFGRGCLGCRLDPERISESRYIETLLKSFNFVTVPINWAQIERSKGDYDFSKVDACIEAIGKKKVALCGGPLLRFSKEYIPVWLRQGKGGFEKIREAAYQFAATMAGRYTGVIRSWRVISGLNAFNYFGFSFEQTLEMTRAANMAVKQASERARKIIEVTNPWGEYYSITTNTIPPLVYVDMVVQSGINFDAFGLPMQFGKNQPGMHIRDMMHISAVLDYFALIAKPLYITEVEVPSQNGQGPQQPEVAGMWHGQWGQSQQSQWIEQFYKIAFSKPFVDTVTYSNLLDTKNSTIGSSGLFTEDFKPKQAFLTLQNLQKTFYNR